MMMSIFNRFIFFILLLTFSVVEVSGAVSDTVIVDTIRIKHKSRKFLVLPALVKSIETSFGFGLAGSFFFKTNKKDTTIRTSNIEALGLYTLRHQDVFLLGCNVYFPKEKYILRWRNTFTHFPDKFWGLGNNTQDNWESYDFTQLFINPQLLRKIYKTFFVGITYEMQRVFTLDYKEGGYFDQQDITGRGGSTVSGLGVLMAYDTRNNAFSTTKGFYTQVLALGFGRVIGSEYNFGQYIIDTRKFFPVRKKDVIALQSYLYFNSGNVAYRNMAYLGGSDMMRGYYAGRFRDINSIAFQGEYRLHVYGRFGIVGFAGMGEVSDNLKNFNIRTFHYSWGGGLRFKINRKENYNLRLDYGVGQGTSGLYFTVSEAF